MFLFIALIAAAFAADPQPVEDKDPQVLGTGAIAEDCAMQFASRIARTACEVHIRMELREETRERIMELEQRTGMLTDFVLELRFRVQNLEDENVALRRQLAALEAKSDRRPTAP